VVKKLLLLVTEDLAPTETHKDKMEEHLLFRGQLQTAEAADRLGDLVNTVLLEAQAEAELVTVIAHMEIQIKDHLQDTLVMEIEAVLQEMDMLVVLEAAAQEKLAEPINLGTVEMVDKTVLQEHLIIGAEAAEDVLGVTNLVQEKVD
jgi:hypothetical protein